MLTLNRWPVVSKIRAISSIEEIPMQADQLRKLYLDYFAERGHARLESASLVPKDPTLLFTAAGMVQFKDIFWGRVSPPHRSAVTCQKCFRTTDIENVGKTAYHHTFFEMLGNFSFGDYFKERAIELAWEFLVRELSLPAERLWVSVYEEDEDAYAIWQDSIGVPTERITRFGKEHNWWGPVGDTGPCGPDSEIFYDTGVDKACGLDCHDPACDRDRFIEIWNLVFMEYEAETGGNLIPLARKSIDTGMGLERTAAVLQGVRSNFEIDLFSPITAAIEEAMPRDLAPEERIQRNLIADHIRGVTMLLADGIFPGNEKQGYVLRRILRRAIRAGEGLGLPPGTLNRLVEPIAATLGKTYPEIVSSQRLIEQIIAREEETFRKTLRSGERRLYKRLEELSAARETLLPGDLAFELYDTYGFPVEMTREIASEQGVSLDEDGFQCAMAQQKKRSRTAAGKAGVATEADMNLEGSRDSVDPTRFVGYSTTTTEAMLVETGEGDLSIFIFDQTPFYAAAGGQIADTGTIENLSQPGRAKVVDVHRDQNSLFLHHVLLRDGTFAVGDRCRLIVDPVRRKRIARNHTTTHLLHAALRNLLGEHVVQSGSFVSAEELRFDFSHFQQMNADEIARVEEMSTAVVLDNFAVETREMPLDEAKQSGAIAHFEEEYKGKDLVRVVSVGGFSVELCGGTHVTRSGEIGLIKIVSEESVAAGTRRIRALTGESAIAHIRSEEALLNGLKEELGDDPLAGLTHLRAELSTLRKQADEMREVRLCLQRDELLARGEKFGEVTLVAGRAALAGDEVKRLADLLEERVHPAVVILISETSGRGIAVCKVSRGIDTVNAGALVGAMSKVLGGGGGGNRAFAQGGGPAVEQIDRALDDGVDTVRAALIAG